MTKYFDIHNHLFNKHFLAKELLYRLMKEFKKIITDQTTSERDIRSIVNKVQNAITAMKRISYALKVFGMNNSIAIYEELDKNYNGEFILTPLTFDLTYCFAPTPDRDGNITREPELKSVFETEMQEVFEELEQGTLQLSRDYTSAASEEENELWEEYNDVKAQFLKDAAELHLQDTENIRLMEKDRGIGDLPDIFDGFGEQIKQITDLKDHPDYKDMIYPFLAVDPRRPGILDYARNNVGKGKLFAGIKLYCPNGYSPTDPLLFGKNNDRDGLYAFCEDNGIPVTAHNSDGGFATLADSVDINGLIHINGVLYQSNNERVIFTKKVFETNGVYERAITLNHPLIWEKVVEKYPGLILNLAHFGGGKQLNAAIDDPDNETLWCNRIIAMVKNPDYNVYTDVSCFTEFDILKKFYKSPVFQEIKHRVLYGSDYTLLLLFENDFKNNVKQFKELFGNDFLTIAGTNPAEFLKYVI